MKMAIGLLICRVSQVMIENNKKSIKDFSDQILFRCNDVLISLNLTQT